MNVLVLTESGAGVGFGHVTRCAAVCQAFQCIGVQPRLVVRGGVAGADWDGGGGAVAFDWIVQRDSLAGMLTSIDVVFVDSYLAAEEVYREIRSAVPTCVYFDDDRRLRYPPGYVLNGAIHAEEMDYPELPGVRYLLGREFTVLRKDFWRVPDKVMREEIETVLITVGGSDTQGVTSEILGALRHSPHRFKKHVVVTRHFANVAEIERFADADTEIIMSPGAAQMKGLMLEADLAISGCGQTLYELARVGLPVCGICMAANQYQNITGWRKAGFLDYVGRCNESEFEQRLLSAVSGLRSRSAREVRSQAGRVVLDGRGQERVLSAVLSHMGGHSIE